MLATIIAPPVFATSYTHPTKKFSLEFPDKWEFISDYMRTATLVFKPTAGTDDTFRENVNVYITSQPQKMSLKEFVSNRNRRNASQLTGYMNLSEKNLTIGDQPAIEIIAKHNMKGLQLKVMVVYILNDGKGYAITGSALESRFDTFKKAFTKIIYSFRLN